MIITPNTLEMTEFFESQPVEENKQDSYYCYKAMDKENVEIIFSYHKIEESIQVILKLKDYNLAVISGELGSHITIKKDKIGKYLECLFKYHNTTAQLEVRISPRISAHWFTLRKD